MQGFIGMNVYLLQCFWLNTLLFEYDENPEGIHNFKATDLKIRLLALPSVISTWKDTLISSR